MGNLLQSIYIIVLNPVYRLTSKLSNRTRDVIIFAIFLIIFVYFIFIRSSMLAPITTRFFPTMFEKHLFGCFLLIILSIVSVNQPLRHVEWRTIIIIPQMLLGAGIVIAGFDHPIGEGYQTFGFMLLFLFPCLYFVWNNRRDYDRLFTLLIYAMIAANLMLFLVTIYYAFQGQLLMEGPRCAGIMANSNCFSLIGLEMVIGAIYLLISHTQKWIPFLLLCSCMGIGLGIVLMGQMRIAIIILFFCIISSIIFYFKYCRSNNKRSVIHRVVGFIVMFQMLLLSFTVIGINSAVVEAEKAALQEATEQVTATETETETESPDTFVERFDVKGKDANSFSSGRITIWKNYADKLTIVGNNFEEYDATTMTGGISGPYAHNFFLEIGYRCGVPAGLLSMALLLITGVIALRFLFLNRSRELSLLFPILSTISYALVALLDCAVLPFFQAEALCYYIAIIVFCDARSQ